MIYDATDNATLISALQSASAPGDVVRIAPGRYAGYHSIVGKSGNPTAPIKITALDPKKPPVLCDSPSEGLAILSCSWLSIDHVNFDNNRDMGIQVAVNGGIGPGFDFLSPSNNISIADVVVTRTGQGDYGNHDGIKVQHTDHFTIQRAVIETWGEGGGSGIDLVGCQDGLIDDCWLAFPEHTGSTATGITAKGGSRRIKITNNMLQSAGEEAIQIGQNTGLQYFRTPPGTTMSDGVVMNYEAREIEVVGNTVVDSPACIMWMKSVLSIVRNNVLVLPRRSSHSRSPFKIAAAENNGLLRANTATIAENLIAYAWSGLETWGMPFVRRMDGHPSLQTFSFAGNIWRQLDWAEKGKKFPTGTGKLGLPTIETNPVYLPTP